MAAGPTDEPHWGVRCVFDAPVCRGRPEEDFVTTAPHSDPRSELEDWLAGDEPDWDSEPEAPPDATRANGMLHRLRTIRRLRAAERVVAEEQIKQVVAWQAEREGGWLRKEEWLEQALTNYHKAVLVLDPKRLSINLPAGVLASRKGQPDWTIDDEKVLPWLVPAPVDELLAALRVKYEADVARIVMTHVGVERAAALKVPPPARPTVSRSGLKDIATRRDEKGKPVGWGVTANGETVPGVTVAPAERTHDIRFPDPEPADVDFLDAGLVPEGDAA